MDSASAYEQHALEFLRGRNRSSIGAQVLRRWAHTLPRGAEVLEIACGGGYPITQELLAAGLQLWAIDSSATLVLEFQRRFPEIPVRCEKAQESDFFGRRFAAVVAVGLLFLLPESQQVAVITQIANVLVPAGRFLFMAPITAGTWRDMNTGMECASLGREHYEEIMEASGLRILATYEDDGKNNYYETVKFSTAAWCQDRRSASGTTRQSW